MAMEKHIFDIEQVNGPMSEDKKIENRLYGGRFDEHTKSFFAIATLLLTLTISNESCLVHAKRTIYIDFFFIYIATLREEYETLEGVGKGPKSHF